MTVAASIESLAGGQPGCGQGQPGSRAVSRAQSAGWTGVVGSNSSSSSALVAASFRSSWQSMLASLGAEMDGDGKIEAVEVNTAAPGLRAKPGSGQNDSADGESKFPLSSSRAGVFCSSAGTISANDFLTLLVTEMQNQDPTADTDPNAVHRPTGAGKQPGTTDLDQSNTKYGSGHSGSQFKQQHSIRCYIGRDG